MRSIMLGIVVFVGLTGCEDIFNAFVTCTPTREQHTRCEWFAGGGAYAVGTGRHSGACRSHEVACVRPDGLRCAAEAGACPEPERDGGDENAAMCAADGGVGCDG